VPPRVTVEVSEHEPGPVALGAELEQRLASSWGELEPGAAAALEVVALLPLARPVAADAAGSWALRHADDKLDASS
jgi:hypothetical protein